MTRSIHAIRPTAKARRAQIAACSALTKKVFRSAESALKAAKLYLVEVDIIDSQFEVSADILWQEEKTGDVLFSVNCEVVDYGTHHGLAIVLWATTLTDATPGQGRREAEADTYAVYGGSFTAVLAAWETVKLAVEACCDGKMLTYNEDEPN